MRVLIHLNHSDLDAHAEISLRLAALLREAGHEALIVGVVRSLGRPAPTPLGNEADARGVAFRLLQKRFPADPGVIGQYEYLLGRYKPELLVSLDRLGIIKSRIARSRDVRVFDASKSTTDPDVAASSIFENALRMASL